MGTGTVCPKQFYTLIYQLEKLKTIQGLLQSVLLSIHARLWTHDRSNPAWLLPPLSFACSSLSCIIISLATKQMAREYYVLQCHDWLQGVASRMGKEWANWPAGRPADDPPNPQRRELALGREQVELAAPGRKWSGGRQPWVSLMKPGRRPAIHFHG